MKKILTTLLLAASLCEINAQTAVIQEPILITPSYRVYLSPSGNDANSGDSLMPLSTFSAALDKLNTLSGSIVGDVYGEVVFYSGTYAQQINQPYNKYMIGSKRLNVSVRGKGAVLLDGTAITVNPGSGMIYLLGSNIHVKNFAINYSTDNGVRFGYNYSGIVVNSHDILIDSVDVAQTEGHGILVGIGALNANGSSSLIPRAKRFKITNCHVHDAVNYNTAQSQWGSAVKFWNTSHNFALNNHVHDNSGEGIDFDFCDTAEVRDNLLHDNYANVYLDKMQYAHVHRNMIYNETKAVSGILMGLEAFTAFVTDHYMKDIYVENNVILNTRGINLWQGIYSAIQNGIYNNVQIRHNTIIGKQFGNGAQVSISHETLFGQPVANFAFSNVSIDRNIVSANSDSLNNNKLFSAPLNPQPGLTTGYNLFNMDPGFAFNAAIDEIRNALPVYLDPSIALDQLIPNATYYPELVMSVPNAIGLNQDYFGFTRNSASTNVGAVEFNESWGLVTPEKSKLLLSPNPCLNGFQLVSTEDLKYDRIIITDVYGKEQIVNYSYNGEYVSTIGLKAGKYFISLITSKGDRTILPFVVQ
jgi:hypothetical protein